MIRCCTILTTCFAICVGIFAVLVSRVQPRSSQSAAILPFHNDTDYVRMPWFYQQEDQVTHFYHYFGTNLVASDLLKGQSVVNGHYFNRYSYRALVLAITLRSKCHWPAALAPTAPVLLSE